MDEEIRRLARLLFDHGLRYAFGVTGSGPSLTLITELEDLGVRYYPVSHEAAAALMAGTVSKITGRISVSISIKGPGLANMLPGIVHNYFENHPALSLSEAFGTDAPSHQRHKRLDHAALLSPIVKGITALTGLEQRLPALIETAWREIPGPVHLDLCARDTEGTAARPPARRHPSCSGQDARQEIFRRLRHSQRPVLVIGSLASRRNWQIELAALSLPVFTTVSAKGVLDERLAHSAGVFTGDGKALAPESCLLAEADLVIGIGLRNTEVLSPKPLGKPTVIIDEVDHQLADGFHADVLHTGPNADLVSDVLHALQGKRWGLDRIGSLRRGMRRALLHPSWLPAVCFDVLNGLGFPYGLVLDVGSFCIIGEHIWEAGPNRLFLGSNNSRFMGAAIPSAVAAAVCNPKVPVFCVVGDGGMRAYPAEIKLAVEERLPICFVLVTDGRYGSIAGAPRPRAMSDRAITVFQPSWWKAIEAMGCDASPVKSEDSFAAVIQAWGRNSPRFIETTFDPQLYVAMTAQLR